MKGILEGIKEILKMFFKMCSTPEPIENEAAHRRVKAWTKKVIVLYGAFTVLGCIIIVMAFGFLMSLGAPLALGVLSFVFMLTCWGYATMILYIRPIFKSVVKWGSAGYHVGEKIESTHVTVTHEYGDTYRVSSHTENKGCLFAVIAGGARFFVWAFFCVYIGPFLTFKKLRNSLKNLKDYENAANA